MNQEEIEKRLEELPEKVSQAHFKWKTSIIERRRLYAKKYLYFKAESVGKKPTKDELESLVRSDTEYYKSEMEEISLESAYMALYEKLMAAKKLADMRRAF